MRSRPVIGVTCGTSSPAGHPPRYGTNQVYADAVEVGGGVAVMIPPPRRGKPVEVLGRVDALLLPGGSDVHPRFYGTAAGPYLAATDEPRDELELALLAEAQRSGRPVLGICRGLHTINVGCGGTLYQDIEAEFGRDVSHRTPSAGGRDQLAHPVAIEPWSWFAAATGATRLEVNSLHHQAAQRVGRGLRVTATSPDGIVEALESSDHRTVAIQCHPEELLALAWARRLFRSFVGSAKT